MPPSLGPAPRPHPCAHPPARPGSAPTRRAARLAGRATNCTLVATEQLPVGQEERLKDLRLMLSRTHARLRVRDGTLQLADNGTVNGSWVNGQKLQAHTWKVLHDGDV